MMTDNTKRGIAIVAGIANIAHAVHQTFPKKEQLNDLLTLFGQHPNGTDKDYALPDKLVLWTHTAYNAVNDDETAQYIREVFPWFFPPEKLDLSVFL